MKHIPNFGDDEPGQLQKALLLVSELRAENTRLRNMALEMLHAHMMAVSRIGNKPDHPLASSNEEYQLSMMADCDRWKKELAKTKESDPCLDCGHPKQSHNLPRHWEGGSVTYTGCSDCCATLPTECNRYRKDDRSTRS